MDFGFPELAFPFTSKRFMKPDDRYKLIKNIIPSETNLKLLNEMAVHWHPQSKWDPNEMIIEE